jgi:hypothetical protein
MYDFIHLTSKLWILVKHRPDHIIELRVEALHQLPKFPLKDPGFIYMTLLVSDIRLVQKIWGLIFVQSNEVV